MRPKPKPDRTYVNIMLKAEMEHLTTIVSYIDSLQDEKLRIIVRSKIKESQDNINKYLEILMK